MDLLSDFLSGLIGLLVNGVLLTIPIAMGTVLGVFVFNFVQKKTGMKWVGSAALTLFLMITLFFLGYHTLTILSGVQDTNLNLIPPDIRAQPEYQQSEVSALDLAARAVVQSVLTGIIFSFLILPFAFLGVSVFEQLKTRAKGVWPRILFTCFVGALLLILLVVAFPWIPVSLVYLAFFGL